MMHIDIPGEIPVRRLGRTRSGDLLLGGMILVGLLALVVTFLSDPDRARQAYVSNWLFFYSIAQGAVIFAAITTIVKARWNWSVRRVSLGFAAFLPIAFVLFLPMLTLGESYFPWIEQMAYDPIVQKKAAYLNLPFLMTRSVVGLLALIGLSLYFTRLMVRPDVGLVGDDGDPRLKGWKDRLTQNWLGQEAEEVRSWKTIRKLAPALILVYAAVMSFLIFDYAMSLEPHWFSTLFGAWFFMGALWGGIAATALATVWLKGQHADFDRFMGLQQLHDLGKLTFAFSIFWTYLFFSQYIVIWYGKLPWEQAWVIHRSVEPWSTLSLLVLFLCFIVPFAALLGKTPKTTPAILGVVTAIIMVGLWLERYLLVVPSLRPEGPVMGLAEPLIALFFLGLFLGSLRWFFTTFPVIQVWQPMADAELMEAETAFAD
ncbi:MAG: hypothetical protein WEA09_05120 [Gemmatimonadota bacterium]